MKLRSLASLGIIACLSLFAMVLLSACGSAIPREGQVETNVSIDEATHSATIQIKSTGDSADIALFLTDPDGNRTRLISANVGAAGGTIDTGGLSPGNYTYTVYAKPHGPGGNGTLPDSAISPENVVATGAFTIP